MAYSLTADSAWLAKSDANVAEPTLNVQRFGLFAQLTAKYA